MTDNIKELLNLIKANPDLPIVPLVEHGIGDDYVGYWVSEWGGTRVEEYCAEKDLYGDEHMEFRPTCDTDMVTIFERYFDYEECGITDDMPDEDAYRIMKEKVDSLPWTKAVVVNINAL